MKNIEFEKIKREVFAEEKSAEYEAWLNSDDRHREFDSRVKNYYETGIKNISEQEVETCWNAFPKRNHNKRRLAIKILGGVAAACAVLFISINLVDFNPSNTTTTIAEAVKQADVLEIPSSTTTHENVTITTSNGAKYVIEDKLKQLDLQEHRSDSVVIENENTIFVPKGKTFFLTLSDGTKVHLNSNTTLTFPASFENATFRNITLEGEAYFDVAKNEEQQFVVNASGLDIRVYGTQFNVNTNNKGRVEAVLVEGSISAQAEGAKESMMLPNELLTFHTETAETTLAKIDVENYISWKSGIYRFNKQRLDYILTALSLSYNVEFVFEDNKACAIEYICNIPRFTTIDDVMNILADCGNIGYRKQDNKIYIWLVQ